MLLKESESLEYIKERNRKIDKIYTEISSLNATKNRLYDEINAAEKELLNLNRKYAVGLEFRIAHTKQAVFISDAHVHWDEDVARIRYNLRYKDIDRAYDSMYEDELINCIESGKLIIASSTDAKLPKQMKLRSIRKLEDNKWIGVASRGKNKAIIFESNDFKYDNDPDTVHMFTRSNRFGYNMYTIVSITGGESRYWWRRSHQDIKLIEFLTRKEDVLSELI